jgi:shikimate kinase
MGQAKSTPKRVLVVGLDAAGKTTVSENIISFKLQCRNIDQNLDNV